MVHHFTRAAFAVAGCVVVVAAAPAAIAATPPASFAPLQQRAEAAIQMRLSDLQGAQTIIGQTTYLTPTDRAALTAIINGDINGSGSVPGLVALNTTIEGATTRASVVTAAATITASYRVYALALPQVHLTVASDELTLSVVPLLNQAESDISKAITVAGPGKNVSGAQAALSDLQHQVASIGTDTAGLPAQIDAFTPTDWNANPALLSPSRQQLAAALRAAQAAGLDITTAIADLG